MKIKNIITVLLVAIILTSCAPAAKVVITETALPLATFTPLPQATPTITPIPSATPVPFSLSGNFAVAEEDKINVYSVEGKIIRTIQTDGWVRNYKFSQQGKMAAYSAFNKLENDMAYYPYGLKIIGLEDNQRHTVVDGNTRVLNFLWDDVGDKLIYITLDGVYSFTLDGGTKKENLVQFPDDVFERPTESFFEIYPSPDYQSFAIEEIFIDPYMFNMYFLSINQKAIKKLNDTSYNASNSENKFGGWTQNGNYFYYRADTSNHTIETFVFSTTSVALVNDFPNPYPIAWSPNSNFITRSQRQNQRSILINDGNFSNNWEEIYSIPSTGGNEFNNMAWSPNSKQLAITLIDYFSPSTQQLLIYDSQNRQVEVLVEILDIFPRNIFWGSDGKYLLITDSEKDATFPEGTGVCQFRIFAFSENKLIQIPDMGCFGIVSSSWSLDGSFFAFTTVSEYSQETQKKSLYIIDIESATVQEINIKGNYDLELIH